MWILSSLSSTWGSAEALIRVFLKKVLAGCSVLLSVWVSVNTSHSPLSGGHRTSPPNYGHGEMVCDCLFRAEVKVLRKSVISFLSFLQTRGSFPPPSAGLMKPSKKNISRGQPLGVWQAFGWKERRSEEQAVRERVPLVNPNWRCPSARILPTLTRRLSFTSCICTFLVPCAHSS